MSKCENQKSVGGVSEKVGEKTKVNLSYNTLKYNNVVNVSI